MNEKTIVWKNCKWYIKVAIVGGWLCLVTYGISFFVGFIEGIIW